MTDPTDALRAELTELIVKRTIAITDDDICRALALCHALAGGPQSDSETVAWAIAHENTIIQLIAEADRRQLDLSTVLTAVDREPLLTSMRYRRARGEASDAEFSRWRRDLKAGKI